MSGGDSDSLAVVDPGLRSGGPKSVLGKCANGAKQSCANEVSFKCLGSGACLKALEALGIFFAEYAFSLFLRYFYVIFLKQLNTNLS